MHYKTMFFLAYIMILAAGCSNRGASQPGAFPSASQPGRLQPTHTELPKAPTPGAQATVAAANPSPSLQCNAPAQTLPQLTEGPFYKPGSPETVSLAGDQPGTRLVLTGIVLDADCQPIPHAWLDFWQADSRGQYDNQGFTLRGHQYTDENGRYQLETVIPGLYPGRTEHIHFKVQAPGGPVITSQLFFPDVAENTSDGIFDPALVMQIMGNDGSLVQAEFNMIIPRQ